MHSSVGAELNTSVNSNKQDNYLQLIHHIGTYSTCMAIQIQKKQYNVKRLQDIHVFLI